MAWVWSLQRCVWVRCRYGEGFGGMGMGRVACSAGFGGMVRVRVAWGKEIHRQNRNGKGVGAGG